MEDHYEVFFGYVSKKSITTIYQESKVAMYFDVHVRDMLLGEDSYSTWNIEQMAPCTEEERRRRERVFMDMEYHSFTT